MSFASYLTFVEGGSKKHYFLGVGCVAGQWSVFTAWGRVGFVHEEKIYTGGKGGLFNAENNAEAYAKAILRNKVDKGYTQNWNELVSDKCPFIAGEIPAWFSPVMEVGESPKHKAIIKPGTGVVTVHMDGKVLGYATGLGEEEKPHEDSKKRKAPYGWKPRK